MKKIKLNLLAPLSVIAIATSLVCLQNNPSTPEIVSAAEEEQIMYSQDVDVGDFALVYKANDLANLRIDTVNQTLTSHGAWDSSFVSTAKLESDATSYSIKAHVSGTNSYSTDGGIGFNIYFNNENYFTFYMAFRNNEVAHSITEGVFLSHVNGQWDNVWQYAKYQVGGFITARTFTDIWSDYGGWGKGTDRDHFSTSNLRGNSYIGPDKGFDMTMYVDRTTYNGRLVDVLQMQVDAFEMDGYTPATFYTPKYAVDAITNPKGAGERIYAHLKPKIGFWNNGMDDVVYSNIEFKHNKPKAEAKKHKLEIIGTEPETFIQNAVDGSFTYKNDNAFNSAFVYPTGVDMSGSRIDLSATVSGTTGDVNDATVGFGVYYDNDNYMSIYVRWNGSGTIDGVHILTTVNGSDTSSYQGARIPWDTTYESPASFKDLWSDNSGFITDFEFPCGIDDNFNHFKTQSAITIATGFDLNLSICRAYYLGREIDVYQIGITAEGTDNKVHTWYSPCWASDAYTYPNGSEEQSPFINTTPKVCYYAHGAGEITFSNLKCKNEIIIPFDPSSIPFGTRTEDGWELTGSNNGEGWQLGENVISESWELLDVDSHYLEVTAFKENTLSDFFVGGEIKIVDYVGDESLFGLYPYYLDSSNYLFVKFDFTRTSQNVIVEGKLNGDSLGGFYPLVSKELDCDLFVPNKLEVGIQSSSVDIYLGDTPRPTFSYSFARQEFKDRELTDSKVGFVFYNASGDITNFAIQDSRIFDFTPSEDDIPVILEAGSRPSYGFQNRAISLPTYQAFNYLGEAIECKITITTPTGEVIEVEEGTTSFTPTQLTSADHKYTIKVTAIDEWGHEAESIEYTVEVSKYVDPLTPVKKQVLWQTVFVLLFFVFILLLTAGLGVLLIRKNKREAAEAEALNKKNQEKAARDLEEIE